MVKADSSLNEEFEDLRTSVKGWFFRKGKKVLPKNCDYAKAKVPGDSM